MQTKHEIQALLAAAGVGPNRRLGQNFLIDLNLMRLLVDSAAPSPEDVVLEVGCGTGSLTEALAERAGAVVVAEVDGTLAEIARARVAAHRQVQILHTDVLAGKHRLADPLLEALDAARAQRAGRLLLVANLPYHVAAPVMLNLLDDPLRADAMVVTVQKEVAERMVAEAGARHYGVLSILLAATGRVRLLRQLGPGVFWPAPQVTSAMVRYDRDPARRTAIRSPHVLAATVHLFFQHRRKTLKATARAARGDLSRCPWDQAFATVGIDPGVRPEQVTPTQFVALANHVTSSLGARGVPPKKEASP